MSGKPLVSAIIIFLNAERFIREAIEGVFAQTYDKWELLLIDDGSTDGSTDIALQYAKQCPGKVRYLEHNDHSNRGMGASRNLGISNAQGEYIAMLDADDVWFPNKLEEQVAVLNSQPEATMVYGATQYWHSWTGNPADVQRDYVPRLGVQGNTLVKPPTLLALYLKGKATTPCPSDILLRREIIESIGGFEETFQGMYEDQAFLAKLYLKAPVFVASKCWDRYRLHPDSCCSVTEKLGQHYTVRLFYLNWLAEYLSGQRVENKEIWAALKSELWLCQYPILRYLSLKHLVRCSLKPLRMMAQRLLPARLRSQLGIW